MCVCVWFDGSPFTPPPPRPRTTVPCRATSLDQTEPDRQAVIDNVLKFLPTDTCCFFAKKTKHTKKLVKRQKKQFTKLHSWMAEDWGMELATTDGIAKLDHPDDTVLGVHKLVNALDSPALTALQCATMETKSIVLGLAVVLRQVAPQGTYHRGNSRAQTAPTNAFRAHIWVFTHGFCFLCAGGAGGAGGAAAAQMRSLWVDWRRSSKWSSGVWSRAVTTSTGRTTRCNSRPRLHSCGSWTGSPDTKAELRICGRPSRHKKGWVVSTMPP